MTMSLDRPARARPSTDGLQPRSPFVGLVMLATLLWLFLFLCGAASGQPLDRIVIGYEQNVEQSATRLLDYLRRTPPVDSNRLNQAITNRDLFTRNWDLLNNPRSSSLARPVNPQPPAATGLIQECQSRRNDPSVDPICKVILQVTAQPPRGNQWRAPLAGAVQPPGTPSPSQFPATMTLTGRPNPAAVSTGVDFIATVTGNRPTGDVSFTEGPSGTVICGAVALNPGWHLAGAICHTNALSVGQHNIVATYGGDGNNLGTTAPLIQVITPPITPPQHGSIEFASESYEVRESAGSVTIQVRRVGGADGDVQVDFQTDDGSAMSVESATTRKDYDWVMGTRSWTDQDSRVQTITIRLVRDDFEELDKDFYVTLSNPTGGATLGSNRRARILIIDDSKEKKRRSCYLNLEPRSVVLRAGESITFRATAVLSDGTERPVTPQTWSPGPTSIYTAPADPHFDQRVRITAIWTSPDWGECSGTAEVTVQAADWSPPMSHAGQLGARGEQPGPADYTWYAVCKKAVGEVVYRENPDIIADHVMAGPFPGPRNAEFWIQQNCPRWRCTLTGACAADPAASATGRPAYFALCSKATGDIVIGQSEDVTRYFTMSPALLGEPDARLWITRNCPTNRCTTDGRCAVAPQPAATGADGWFTICDLATGAVTFGKQVPPGSRAMVGPLRGEPDVRTWAAANCPTNRCTTDGVCAKAPVSAPTGSEGWYVLCDLTNGGLLYGKQVPSGTRALAGPFIGEPDARMWTQTNCPSQRCTHDGFCAPGAAPTSTNDALRMFSERETERQAGRGTSISIGPTSGGPYTSQGLIDAMRAGQTEPGSSHTGTSLTGSDRPNGPGAIVPPGPTTPAVPTTPTKPTTPEQKQWYGIETKVVYDWGGRKCTLTDAFEGEATPSGLPALTNAAQGKALAPVRGASGRTVLSVNSRVYAGPMSSKPSYSGKTGVQCNEEGASGSGASPQSSEKAQDYMLEAVAAYERIDYPTGSAPRTITCTLTGYMVYLMRASEIQAALREWGQGNLQVVRSTKGTINGRLVSTRVVSGPSAHIPYPSPQHKIACAQ